MPGRGSGGLLLPILAALIVAMGSLWIGQVGPFAARPAAMQAEQVEEEPEQPLAKTVYLLKQTFVQDMVRVALLVGASCAFLGVFVVLKRIVFVGAALANVASLGAALAFSAPAVAAFAWIVHQAPALEPLEHFKPLVFALVLMLLAVAFFSQHRLGRRIPREAIIGTAYAAAAGITLILLSKVQAQDQHTLDVLKGSILGVPAEEISEVAIAAAIIGVMQALFYKEFVLVSFDPEVARTLGYNSSRWELLWYLTLGLMIAVSIHVSGTVLVFAYLVIPPVTALLLTRRLNVALFLSVLFAVLATVVGTVLSVYPGIDVATSYCIVGVSAALFVLAWAARVVMNRFKGA
jgi:ABC-type Mn2+/Zn2+ transport system permease subunit